MLIYTQSGSVYEYDEDEERMRRVPIDQDGELRHDGEWLEVLNIIGPNIGEGMWVNMGGEGVKPFMRRTSKVVAIEETD